jgi:hypothetical protein
LRRRTSLLTRMTCDVLQRAAELAGADLRTARIVLASGWGELEVTLELLGQLAVPEPPVSPALFHNSVYNTAPAYVSIALGNHESSTALGAGPDGLAAGMLEALTTLEVEGGEVMLVVADEPIPKPFVDGPRDPIALGLCLRRLDDPGPSAHGLTIELVPEPPAGMPTATEDRGPLYDNPSRFALPLARAIEAGLPAWVRLGPRDGPWGTLRLEREPP